MRSSTLGSLLVCGLAFAHLPDASADRISVDADSFPEDAALTNAFPGVTLTMEGRPDQTVVARIGYAPFLDANIATTGTKVFGNVPGLCLVDDVWSEDQCGLLRADFQTPVSYVQVDLLFDDDDIGQLRAYDSAGNILDLKIASGDGRGPVPTATVAISRSSADIAYVLAGGVSAEGHSLDNLQYETTPPSVGPDYISATVAAAGARPGTIANLTDAGPDGAQNLTTSWRNDGTGATAWFTLDLGAEHSVYELRVAPRGDISYDLSISVGSTLTGGKVSQGSITICKTWGIDSGTPTYLQNCYLSASGRYVTVQGSINTLRVHGIEVYGSPPGDLNAQPIAQYSYQFHPASLAVDFDASGSSDSDGSVAAYEWDFGDGTTGTGEVTNHQYASEGQYRIPLTVTDSGGVKATQSQRVSIYSSGLSWLRVSRVLDAGANDSHAPRIFDRVGTFQNLATSWGNDGSASTAWFTLDLGSSRSIGELKVAPRADRNYNLAVSIGDTLSAGKVTGPVDGYCLTTAGAAQLPTALQTCQVSGQGRYVTVQESVRKWLTFHGVEVLGVP